MSHKFYSIKEYIKYVSFEYRETNMLYWKKKWRSLELSTCIFLTSVYSSINWWPFFSLLFNTQITYTINSFSQIFVTKSHNSQKYFYSQNSLASLKNFLSNLRKTSLALGIVHRNRESTNIDLWSLRCRWRCWLKNSTKTRRVKNI
jgi:hypothetical protein